MRSICPSSSIPKVYISLFDLYRFLLVIEGRGLRVEVEKSSAEFSTSQVAVDCGSRATTVAIAAAFLFFCSVHFLIHIEVDWNFIEVDRDYTGAVSGPYRT